MKIFKIILSFIIIVAIICINFWIVKNFEDNTMKYGIIDKHGNTKISFTYSYLRSDDLCDGQKYISAIKENLLGFNAKKGNIDLDGNEYFDENEPGLEYLGYIKNRAIKKEENSGKYELIDCNGNKITKRTYDMIDDDYFSNNYYITTMNSKKGIIDIDGNEILPCIYDDVYTLELNIKNGIIKYFLTKKNSNTYLVDDQNKILAEQLQNGKYKFIDENEFLSLGEIDENCIKLSNNHIRITENGKTGIYDNNGNKIAYFNSEYTVWLEPEEKFLVYENEKYRIINEFGNTIYETNDNEISEIKGNIIKIYKNKKYGLIDTNGKVIIPIEYDRLEIGSINKNYISVQKDDKYGVLDLDGNEIIKCSSKYKTSLIGNGEYFVTQEINTTIMCFYIGIIVISVVLTVTLIIKILK